MPLIVILRLLVVQRVCPANHKTSGDSLVAGCGDTGQGHVAVVAVEDTVVRRGVIQNLSVGDVDDAAVLEVRCCAGGAQVVGDHTLFADGNGCAGGHQCAAVVVGAVAVQSGSAEGQLAAGDVDGTAALGVVVIGVIVVGNVLLQYRTGEGELRAGDCVEGTAVMRGITGVYRHTSRNKKKVK